MVLDFGGSSFKESRMAHPNGLIPRRLLRGEITCRWHELTSSDVEECTSDRAKLIEVLQARYGYARRRAEKEVVLFFLEFRDRLRLGASARRTDFSIHAIGQFMAFFFWLTCA